MTPAIPKQQKPIPKGKARREMEDTFMLVQMRELVVRMGYEVGSPIIEDIDWVLARRTK